MKNRYMSLFLFGVVAAAGISLSCKLTPVPPSNPCILNGSDTCAAAVKNKVLDAKVSIAEEFQTIHSFGASDCWTIKFIGKNWPVDKRNEIADLLFSKDFDANGNPKGIGLSLWRINVGAGSFEQGVKSKITSEWRREESFQNPDGSYDWSKQAGNRWFAQAAKSRGVENLLLFSISPPIHMTKNGLAFGSSGLEKGKLNLQPDKYADFGDFLSEVAKNFTQSGLPINYISPLNEPQWDWTGDNNGEGSQEGTAATNEESFKVVKELDNKIKSKNLSTKIAFGEVGAIDHAYGLVPNNPLRSDVFNYFWNPLSANYIGNFTSVEKVLSYHSYFAQPNISNLINHRDNLVKRVKTINPAIKSWQTEYCVLLQEDQTQGNGRDLGINSALYIARVIHTDLAIGNAAAWHWWLGVSLGDYKDGLVYLTDINGSMNESLNTKNNGLIFKSKMLWAMGNFSRFIRPGMIRVNASIEGFTDPSVAASNMMISAYKNPQRKEIVMVVINMTDKSNTIKFSNIPFSSSNFKVYTTSESKEMRFSELSTTSNISIEPKSVSTFVCGYN